jgi:hypothetical protein
MYEDPPPSFVPLPASPRHIFMPSILLIAALLASDVGISAFLDVTYLGQQKWNRDIPIHQPEVPAQQGATKEREREAR